MFVIDFVNLLPNLFEDTSEFLYIDINGHAIICVCLIGHRPPMNIPTQVCRLMLEYKS